MQQTNNYQLNQWDAEDRILRENFNNDNAKLDAALKQQADALSSQATALAAETAVREALAATVADKHTLYLIQTAELAESAGKLEVDLSSINWSEWKAVLIYIQTTGSGSWRAVIGNTINTEVICSSNFTGRLLLLPMYDPEMKAGGILTGSSQYFLSTSVLYKNMAAFGVSTTDSDYSLNAGSALTVKGIK